MGEVKKPIIAYVRKPGVDYGADAGGGRRGRVDRHRRARRRARAGDRSLSAARAR